MLPPRCLPLPHTAVSHVNKKAIDHYRSSAEQRKDLTERRAQQERDHKAILETIEKLDRDKDEAIFRTLKTVGVSAYTCCGEKRRVPDWA